MTTRCHSVRSFRSPVCRSFQVSLVATDRLAILVPDCRVRISGSLPRLPTRITLLTLPAIASIPYQRRHSSPRSHTLPSYGPSWPESLNRPFQDPEKLPYKTRTSREQ